MAASSEAAAVWVSASKAWLANINPKAQIPSSKSSVTKSKPFTESEPCEYPELPKQVLIWDLGFGVLGFANGNAADGFSVRTFVRDTGRSVSLRAKP